MVLIDGARNAQECNHIDLRYVQSTAARVRDHAVEMAAKRRRLARVRSSEEFFCTVRSLLASFDRAIFSLTCGLLQPRSQAPPSFLSLAVRQTLAGRRVWSTAHIRLVPTPPQLGWAISAFAATAFILCRYNSDVSRLTHTRHAAIIAKQCKLCGAQLLIAHPSWGVCWNKSYMGSWPDSPPCESLDTRDYEVRFSVLQATEGWAGPGNEAFAWRCQLAPLLGGRPRKATKHSSNHHPNW